MALTLQLGGQELRDKRHPTCHYMGSDVEDMEPRAAQAHPYTRERGFCRNSAPSFTASERGCPRAQVRTAPHSLKKKKKNKNNKKKKNVLLEYSAFIMLLVSGVKRNESVIHTYKWAC